MSLKVLYSDRIEDLAADLRERLIAERSQSDPFLFPQITVPNANIAKWLQIRVFSKERLLCAGMKFPFVEQRLTELMAANLPPGTPFSLLPNHAYATAVMGALLAKRGAIAEFDALKPLRAYISGGDGKGELVISTRRQARMAWQLAVKMADLLDQYEVRRPEIVANWLKGLSAEGEARPATETEAAEAALARIVWGRDGVFPPDGDSLSLRQLFDRVSSTPPKGPAKTIYFFGFSTLSLLQVKILAWLAETHEVVFYHNNVCLEYWGDIENRQERIKRLGMGHADEEDISVENPLLRQWGVAGRETMRLLVQLEEENDGRISFEWTSLADPGRERKDTVLGRIQDSICHCTGDIDKVPQDASIQVIGVPGIRREVEMVYNSILGSVWKPDGSGERPWPDCSFSDIAVLVPDMSTYRPFIEAVFDARGQVPYGLIDTSASEDSRFLAGFMALADVARNGLTRKTLFAVLDNPCVQKALGFNGDDVDDWRELTARIGAFDGFEEDGESKFNWDWALSRLRLARVAEHLNAVGEEAEDLEEPRVVELPLAPDGDDNSALRFSAIVELIYRKTAAAFGEEGKRRLLPCAIDFEVEGRRQLNWAFVLSRLAGEFLAVPDDSLLEGNVQRQISQTLNSLVKLPGEQDCEVVLAAVEQFVGGISCRRGGYLTHGVTVAGLHPMRPVPFKQIYILGLGANGFPGRTGSSTLDVRGVGWRLGDTTVPKVNRLLFLETLMSARDRFVISYQNRDIEKDAELFPSGIVRELEDFAASAISGGQFVEFKGYPLLERGEGDSPLEDVEWRADDPRAGLLPTYSRAARNMARERMGFAPQGVAAAEQEAVEDLGPKSQNREVSARELAEFLKSPLRAVLSGRLGIAIEGYRDNELETDSPVGIPNGPVKWELNEASLEDEEGVDSLFRAMQLAGRLPAGFIGEFAKEKLCENILPNAENMRNFVAQFGVKEGVDLTSRLRIPAVLKFAGEEVKVQYVAQTQNWLENEDGVSVLVSGWLKDISKEAPPIDRTLEPFIAFLMNLAKREDGLDEMASLRVGVLDIDNALTAVWRWQVSPKEARNYIHRLTERYLTFLDGDTTSSSQTYIDFTYKKLASAIGGRKVADCDWTAVLGSLTAEEFSRGKKKDGFNSKLVVEQAIEPYRRDPLADELKDLYVGFYMLAMSGVKEPCEDGGAQ